MYSTVFVLLVFVQQSPEEGTRSLWDTSFLANRPIPKKATPEKAAPARPAAPATDVGSFVGVTIWRLRPSLPADDMNTRLFLHEEREKSGEWTLERVSSGAPLSEGQRVRLSIETAQAGYLYVIDREQYASGAQGEPYLIFPTTKLRGGNNQVSPGLLVEIPGRDDSPPYIWLRRERDSHVGEVLTILVTPKPLEGVTTTDRAQILSPQLVDGWIRRWGGRVQRLDAASLAGKPYTGAELAAAQPGGKPLAPSDPVPQTLYRVDAKPGEPLVVTVPLQIRR